MSRIRHCVVIVGGVNGSGKSTFARRAAETELLLGQTAINPDELSKEAQVELPALNDSGASLAGAERAERLCGVRLPRGEA